MRRAFLMIAVGLGMLIVSLAVAQTSRPSNQRTNAARLTQPWSKMNTLTNEQIAQISDIHRKTLADVKAIEAKERSDIIALLTDEQKIELNRVENPGKTTNAP